MFLKLYPIMLIAAVIGLSISNMDAQSEDCSETQFTEFGMNGVVSPGNHVWLRSDPSVAGATIRLLLPGEPFNVIHNSTECSDGTLWIEIKMLDPGHRGWTVERSGTDEPLIVVYEDAEPRIIGELQEDGSYVVDENGLRMEIPPALNAGSTTLETQVGFFSPSMSVQPSSIILHFTSRDDRDLGKLQIFPYAILGDLQADYWFYDFDPLLTMRSDLLEYAADNRMPQDPIGGSRAIIGGAAAYLDFASISGVRYVTYFAQGFVVFDTEDDFTYLFRGLTSDRAFLIAGEVTPVRIPAEVFAQLDSDISFELDEYSAYIRQLERVLAQIPTDTFSPDLALLDMLVTSLEIVDNDLIVALLP